MNNKDGFMFADHIRHFLYECISYFTNYDNARGIEHVRVRDDVAGFDRLS